MTVGDSFSGSIVGNWLAANAVMGYDSLDLMFLEKNITSDLERFMIPPGIADDPDSEVAVPYKPRSVPVVTELSEDENASAKTLPTPDES